MNRALLLLPCALLALLVGTALADPPANPFEGTWQGSYGQVGGTQVGTLEITIEANGRIRGVADDSDLGATLVRGKMHGSGEISMSFKSDVGNGSLHGTGVLDHAGNLVLIVENPSNGSVFRGVLTP